MDPMSVRPWSWVSLSFIWASSLGAGFQPDLLAPEHAYFSASPKDAFSRRIQDSGLLSIPLDRSGELAFVRSLLAALDMPESSQLLVFSNTSLQLSLISASNPRALYFNDELYLGWVPGGKIEVATVDPDLGAVFYIFDVPRDGIGPVQVERARRCMNCHANEDTFHVPGLAVKSVAPAAGGGSLDTFRKEMTGHAVPIGERLGGWYVTGDGNPEGHLGNRLGRLYQGDITWTRLDPGVRFRWDRYPVATSDLLAHLVHEHQVGGVNRMSRAQYRVRELRHRRGGSLGPADWAELEGEVEELVRYLLFAGETVLPPISGGARFREEFGRNARRVDGLSLKDLDLKDRLFRHRCSFLVYTGQFAGMDVGLRARVVDGMKKALAPGDANAGFKYLEEAEKGAIRRILAATLPGW